MIERENEDLVPVTEAAKPLRMSREQVIRRVQRGAISGGKVMGQWVVERSALQKALADQIRAAEIPGSLAAAAQELARRPASALQDAADMAAASLEEVLNDTLEVPQRTQEEA